MGSLLTHRNCSGSLTLSTVFVGHTQDDTLCEVDLAPTLHPPRGEPTGKAKVWALAGRSCQRPQRHPETGEQQPVEVPTPPKMGSLFTKIKRKMEKEYIVSKEQTLEAARERPAVPWPQGQDMWSWGRRLSGRHGRASAAASPQINAEGDLTLRVHSCSELIPQDSVG